MKLSRAVEAIPPSGIRRFFDVVSQMDDVISLGVGEPDFGTAWRVREAAIYGLERGRTSYTANSGLLELRQAIAAALPGYQLVMTPVARPEASSPSVGLLKVHQAQEADLLERAFGQGE